MFAKLVGDYLLTFGNIELTLESAIISIIKIVIKGNEEELEKLIKFFLAKQSTSKKLETLKFLIKYLDSEKQEDWLAFYSRIKNLSETRNMLAHGMYGVENDKFLKIVFDKDGKLKETIISAEDFQEFLNELCESYRQLFDSVIEPQSKYISKYPKLEI